MSRNKSDGTLFIGRLNKNARVKDLEDIFETYGRLTRCDIKYGGAEMGKRDMAYGFIDFEDKRDAEDALRYENGRNVCGSNIIVEWAKGTPRTGGGGGGGGGYGSNGRGFSEECYKCHRPGHLARNCTEDDNGGGGRFRNPPYRPSGGGRDRGRDRSGSRERYNGRRNERSRSR